MQFQSTHPVRGATEDIQSDDLVIRISIHAPREGCDGPRPRSRPGTLRFQSTHPVRGATGHRGFLRPCGTISIHAPREGCDPGSRDRTACTPLFQSTHPVRGATLGDYLHVAACVFQSTHPVRGATRTQTALRACSRISIHAPREGCDPVWASPTTRSANFNPRTP